MNKRAFLDCVGLVVLAASSLAAHHSPVMFDRSVSKTLVGTVVQFTWTNPHSSIQIDVPNDKGGAVTLSWLSSTDEKDHPNGWRSNLLKAGDKVTVVVHPLKSGEFGGIFVSLELADGRKLGGRPTD